MKKRVYFSAWGNKVNQLNLPAYAVGKEYETKLEAVVRACERKSGLVCCAGPRSEGTALEKGKPYANHYAFTLGYPAYGGGFNPVAQVWISIPINQEKGEKQ